MYSGWEAVELHGETHGSRAVSLGLDLEIPSQARHLPSLRPIASPVRWDDRNSPHLMSSGVQGDTYEVFKQRLAHMSSEREFPLIIMTLGSVAAAWEPSHTLV